MQTPIRMSELVTAARFYSSEEADAFYELAMEAGARVRLVEPEMVGRGFDLSLGATERMVAFAVMVHPEDWDALEQAMECKVEIDPHDPVVASSPEELRALLAGPRDANLPERVIARKILSALPPAILTQPSAPLEVLDIHLQGDEKTGGWLTFVAMIFTLCFVTVILFLAKPWGADDLYAYGLTPGGGAEGTYREAMLYEVDPFAAPIKGLLPLVMPVVMTLAVIFTRRRLKDGRVRPMFPRGQRQVCWCALGLCILVYIFCCTLAVYQSVSQYHAQIGQD